MAAVLAYLVVLVGTLSRIIALKGTDGPQHQMAGQCGKDDLHRSFRLKQAVVQTNASAQRADRSGDAFRNAVGPRV